MYLNSLGGTNGFYYPGMSDTGTRTRNKHVGGFNDEDAYGGNTNTANAGNQNAAAGSANATNLTQNAPQATGGAQSVGQAGDQTGQAGQTGNSSLSPDFTSEESLLTTLMDKSLEAMNIVPSSQIAATQISFSGLSYDVSSSQSAAVGVQGNQVGAAVDDSQSATLEGEGQIVTADGSTYAFTIALQVGDDQQASASAPLQSGANAASGLPSSNDGGSQATSGNGLGSLNLPDSGSSNASSASNASDASNSSLGNYLVQLLDALRQATSPNASDPNAFLQSPTAATSATSSGVPATAATSSASSAGAASSQPTINWDAIQQQTSSLIDMLDAMISVNQNAAGSSGAAGANTAATTAAATTAAAASAASNNTATTVAA